MELLVVLTTLPDAEAAEKLARTLVSEKLAACVNIVPQARSIYMWKGELCNEGETLCFIKTRPELTAALRLRIVALHPYEVPEVVMLAATGVHLPYLEWIRANTRDA